MASVFKIAQNPTFKADVMIPRVGGKPLKINFEFKYLDRVQLAALYDSWDSSWQEISKDINAEENENMTLAQITDIEVTHQVRQLKDIIVGWGFEDEFNDEAIRALVTASIGATSAVIAAYQEEYVKAKLKN